MDTVEVLWGAVAGTALTLAGVHGFLWFFDRRALANLTFGIVAIGVAGVSIAELGMMHATSAAEFGEWLRWLHLPNFFVMVGLVIFVRLQIGTGRVWLAVAIIALRLSLLIVNFIVDPNVSWREVLSIRATEFLGQPIVVVGEAVVRPTQWVATLSSVLFIVYVADAMASACLHGDREACRKARIICGGILGFVTIAIVESQLVVWNLVQMPVVVAPPFVILMIAVTYEVSRGIFVAKRAEREAQLLRDELAHVARVGTVTHLSSSLAHELNQPLTSILLNARAGQLMLQGGKADLRELQAILEDISSDDLRAAAIVERARHLLKRTRAELADVSLDAVVREVGAVVRSEATKRQIGVESTVPPDLPLVRADRVQLSQVLLNLVLNAMDAVRDARPGERRITISAKSDAAAVEVAVADSGPGISPDLMPRIFDAFVTTKPTGLGIGLAVSRTIIQAHGGHLWAENDPDRGGAIFRFTLQTAGTRAQRPGAYADRLLAGDFLR